MLATCYSAVWLRCSANLAGDRRCGARKQEARTRAVPGQRVGSCRPSSDGSGRSGSPVYKRIVERTFEWLGRNGRLSKDYEYAVQSSDTMIDVAAIQLMLESAQSGMNFKQPLSSEPSGKPDQNRVISECRITMCAPGYIRNAGPSFPLYGPRTVDGERKEAVRVHQTRVN